jgi:LysW-gamma-L-lysine/LysW-L-ornithine aminotransferase
MQSRYLLDLFPNRGLSFVRGKGVFLETADGRQYLDLMTNYGVSIFGYNHPALTRALAGQLEALPTLHGSFGSEVRARASRALVERLPLKPAFLCWTNSGTEAIEAALKFAVLATGKRRFVACRDAYHGKTLGALSATHSPKYRAPFEPLLWSFAHVEFGVAEALRAAVDAETAAVILEPIQGESGIIVPPEGYLREVRQICDDAGVLLILDEIQTGCGRTGRFTVAEREGVSPDILCLGKGLAGGIPVGVAAVGARVAGKIVRGSHTSTFGGNPLACAGTLAVLDLLTEATLQSIASLGELFASRLRRIESPLVADVRGRGLMVGVAVRDRRDAVLKGLQQEGILAIPAGSDVVRFLPPYIVQPEHLDHAAEALERVLARL